MSKINIILFFLCVFLCYNSACSQVNSNPEIPAVQKYFEEVRESLTGEQAYKTTAYVEQYFRVVGNNGFNKSIYYVTSLLEGAGYVLESKAKATDRFTYRLEKRPMKNKAWEPVNASLYLEGEKNPVLSFKTNRNMVAINSFSTPEGGITTEVVYISKIQELDNQDVKGKIVFSENINNYQLFKKAIQEKGSVGMLVYGMPAYTKPEINVNSIQFGGIPQDEERKAFCIFMSYQAKEKLKKNLGVGKKKVKVEIETKVYPSQELTIVAEIKGSSKSDERFVFSAHVQEPGANDNASGVGCLAEMATTAATLVKYGSADPKRTITFLWGDEIISTRRFVEEDEERAKGILWGMSLDMVGEDTKKTGGSFLIEKMPDPSAIWTRGKDKHSEWGGDVLSESAMFPHYFNDFVINRFSEQGKATNWAVNTNPFEGGSDHTPFLKAKIPGLLAWHFTDMFYHTDGDRIENVSQETLKNVGTGALVIALTLTSADEKAAKKIIDEVEEAAKLRLADEMALSKEMIKKGKAKSEELKIIQTWGKWYDKALGTTEEIPVGNVSTDLNNYIKASQERVKKVVSDYVSQLEKM